MLSATSRGQKPIKAMTPRAAFGAALLAALATICSHTAFAQMERLNAAMQQQMMAGQSMDTGPTPPSAQTPYGDMLIQQHLTSAIKIFNRRRERVTGVEVANRV